MREIQYCIANVYNVSWGEGYRGPKPAGPLPLPLPLPRGLVAASRSRGAGAAGPGGAGDASSFPAPPIPWGVPRPSRKPRSVAHEGTMSAMRVRRNIAAIAARTRGSSRAGRRRKCTRTKERRSTGVQSVSCTFTARTRWGPSRGYSARKTVRSSEPPNRPPALSDPPRPRHCPPNLAARPRCPSASSASTASPRRVAAARPRVPSPRLASGARGRRRRN